MVDQFRDCVSSDTSLTSVWVFGYEKLDIGLGKNEIKKMCVHPKGTYAHLTENSQDFIFLLLSKNFSVCLLGAHTKKLSH